MYYSAYGIRRASERDAEELRHLATLAAKRPVRGRVIVAEQRGRIAAALSLDDDHAISDRSSSGSSLLAALRIRARGIRAHEQTPSLRSRVRAALRSQAAA